MERKKTASRASWEDTVSSQGLIFHTTSEGIPYWKEDAYYQLSMSEILKLEKATNMLHKLCLDAVDHVIEYKRYEEFFIPPAFIPLIEESWNDDHPAIYGRFDLAYNPDSGSIKMLEYNADTPTSLLEAGVIQWFWHKDKNVGKDQFNSIHEKLVAYWKYLKQYLKPGAVHFAHVDDYEDGMTATYMLDTAKEAGLATQILLVDQIGWNEEKKMFVGVHDEPIVNLFKLYPWEWLMHEKFAENIPGTDMYWIEPPWKMILSNKAILPVLWELFPKHEYLLEAHRDAPQEMKSYVRKPYLSREGANTTIVKHGVRGDETPGEYGEEGFVFQELFDFKTFDGMTAIIGSWVIGGESAGMGIRESHKAITDNLSIFRPHTIL